MSEYKDIKNNTYTVIQRVLSGDERKIYTEEEILTQLWRIFSGTKQMWIPVWLERKDLHKIM